jgi:hypothetical protein
MSNIVAFLYSHDGESYSDDKWDYGLLKEIFKKNKIEQIRTTTIAETDRAFVVIPGPQSIGHEKTISDELSKISRVVLFVTGDEGAGFDIGQIQHNNIDIWIQYPHKKNEKYNKLALGVPQHLNKNLPEYQDKVYNCFFAGQITHSRRQELAKVMPNIPNSFYEPTKGFAQGLKPKNYYDKMFISKIVPCPSGAEVIDSFRFYEAIEMLCLPIGDEVDSKDNKTNFYNFLFGVNFPITTVDNWNRIKKIIPGLINEYPYNMHHVVCWWIKYKRDLSIKIMRQVNAN